MRDPYQVLGVNPNATDDEVKKAYRELARKYHPDNYVNTPLADLAGEKMKEVNEAYETIQKMRKEGQQSGAHYSTSGSSYHTGSSTQFQDIRSCISAGDYYEADIRLNSVAVAELKKYAVEATNAGICQEDVMNHFWEIDNKPVEDTLFWEATGIDLSKLK